MNATRTQAQYRITSRIYQGGGVQSRHRTLADARKRMARHDRAVKHLNRNGGSSYHDCRIEEWTGSEWQPVEE